MSQDRALSVHFCDFIAAGDPLAQLVAEFVAAAKADSSIAIRPGVMLNWFRKAQAVTRLPEIEAMQARLAELGRTVSENKERLVAIEMGAAARQAAPAQAIPDGQVVIGQFGNYAVLGPGAPVAKNARLYARTPLIEHKDRLIKCLEASDQPLTRKRIASILGIPEGSLSQLLREPEFQRLERGLWGLRKWTK